MKKRIALVLFLLGLSSQALAVATFGAVSLTVDGSRFYFDVVVRDADPGNFNAFRIGSEGCVFACPDIERIEFNFNGTDGSFTYGPEVQTFDSPTYDRWQDGAITDLSLVNIGGFDWRVRGSVAHGADPYVAGDTVSQMALRTTSDRYLNDVAITQVVPEVLTFNPSPADFGDVVVGQTGGPLVVTFTNTDGSNAIVWNWPTVSPPFVAQEAGTCTYRLDPGATCTAVFEFSPVATGAAQQTLEFIDALGDAPVVLGALVLQGNGIELVTEHTVGGTVSGLTGTLTLQNNGGDDLDVGADGAFTFATALPDGSAYAVTIRAQPAGQTCEVTNGSGTISGADVDDVVVTCTTNTYTVGGTVSGLTGTLTLQNNGGDDLDVGADGAFTFATALPDGSAYAVTIRAQPAGQVCEVNNGNGTISGADVTTVVVDCMTLPPPPPPPPPPAVPEYVDVPTLDRLGMAVLVVLLLGLGLVGLRRVA